MLVKKPNYNDRNVKAIHVLLIQRGIFIPFLKLCSSPAALSPAIEGPALVMKRDPGVSPKSLFM